MTDKELPPLSDYVSILENADNIIRHLGDSLSVKIVRNDGSIDYMPLKDIIDKYKKYLEDL